MNNTPNDPLNLQKKDYTFDGSTNKTSLFFNKYLKKKKNDRAMGKRGDRTIRCFHDELPTETECV